NVMIKYDYDPTASYAGGIAGLAATSPKATDQPLKDNRAAVAAYDSHAAQVSDDITRAIQAAVPGAKIGDAYTTVYAGVRAHVPANKVSDLLAVDGVAAVQKDSLE